MKTTKLTQVVILLIVLFSFSAARGQQWANNGTHIYNTNSGNVGIGTGTSFTPISKLHINNGSTVADIMLESAYSGTSNHSVGNLRLKNSTTGDMFNVTLRKNGTVDEMLQSCYDATNSLWREFIYYNYGTRKYEMRNGVIDAEFKNSGHILLNNSGYVGIKMADPTANLHVAETSNTITAAFGSNISTYYIGTSVAIGDENAHTLLYLGQSSEDKGFIRWCYDANPALTYFSVGTFGGSHPLVFQEVGGNVGIHITNPTAALEVKLDNNNISWIGNTVANPNYFTHSEDPSNGDGQSTVYAYRSDLNQNDGAAYTLGGINTALKGYSLWGDLYSFGTIGFSDLDYTRCGGVFGGYSYGGTWGSLGYKTSGATSYGGYFTTNSTGGGKSSQTAYIANGIGAWGDLFGADVHGKIYGTYTEGENYALYSHGVSYKDNLDVHLQENGNGSSTPLYTNVSTEVTIMTSGTATLSGGKANIVFDKSFRECVSAKEPIVVTVTPNGSSNGVFLSGVSSTGCTIMENNSGKSNITVNYIAIGKRTGYEQPELAKEVIAPDYVNKLARGLHNDNDLQTNGQGLYYENGQLVVGIHPSTLPNPSKHIDKIVSQKEIRSKAQEGTGK